MLKVGSKPNSNDNPLHKLTIVIYEVLINVIFDYKCYNVVFQTKKYYDVIIVSSKYKIGIRFYCF